MPDNFTLQVTDDQGASVTTPANFTVTGTNDAPTLDLNGPSAGIGTTLNYTENDPGTAIAPAGLTGDIDSANFNTGSLRVSFGATGHSDDQITIADQGTGAGQIHADGTTVYFGGVAIGTYSGGDNGNDLLINFTSNAATPAAAQALLRDIDYTNYSDNPTTTPRSATFTLKDGDGVANGGHDTVSATATINVTAVNDAPVLNNGADLSFGTVNEDAGPPVGVVGVQISSLIDLNPPSGGVNNVTDPDNAQIGLAIDGIDTAHGTLWYSADNGNNWVAYNSGGTSDATAILIPQNSLLYYQAAANFNGTVSDAITIRAWDQTAGPAGSLFDITANGGTGGSTAFSIAADTVSITVNSVNDAPSGADNTITTLEDTAHVFSVADFGFSDPNDAPADSLQAVEITTLAGAGSLTNDGVAVNPGDFVTAAAIASGLLVFTPATNGNGTGYATFTFQVQDNGGTANGGVDLDQSANTITVDVTPVNDAPVISDVAASASYTENASGVLLSSGLVVSDVDNNNLASGTVKISSGFLAGDVLAADTTGTGITQSYNAATGVLTLTGFDTQAHYQQVLDSVAYSSTSDNPTNFGADAARTIDWQVNDGTPSFGTPSTIATGSGAVGVAIGDVNGDGIPDLVATNPASNTVSVLLGNGNGTFQTPTTNATGGHPLYVAVADVNGDGKADLVVANEAGSDSNSVSVLLGNGDGIFQTQQAYAVGSNPSWVAVGDFNGDGHPDIVAANEGSNDNSVSVLLNNGDGTFASQSIVTLADNPSSVAVADINHDGNLDIVALSYAGSYISVLLGNGDGTFQSQQTYALAGGYWPDHSVAIGDLNGDGIPDVVATQSTGYAVSVLLGTGNSSSNLFGSAVDYTTYTTDPGRPDDVTIADVNGDGKPDLVVSNVDKNDVAVLIGNGDGTFQTPIVYSGTASNFVAVGDLNGDGKPDIVEGSLGGVSVVLNDSTNLSAVQHSTVNVTAVNDAPVVSGLTASDSDIHFSVSDVDSTSFTLSAPFATAFGSPTLAIGANDLTTPTAQASAISGTLQVDDGAGGTASVSGLYLGTTGDDTVTAPLPSAPNVLYGFAGNDTFHGGSSNDTIVGGAGTDTATYSGTLSAADFSYDAGTNTWTVNATAGGEGTDHLAGIEKVTDGAGHEFLLVDPSGSYTTIQSAINAATAGDTVLVGDGTYNENVALKNGVNVVGESEGGVIIDGTMSTPALFDNTTISNLTVDDHSSTAMLLDMTATTEVTNSTFDHVAFNLLSDSTATILVGNGQDVGSMELKGSGLTFSNVSMNSNDHDFANSTAFAFTLFHTDSGAQMLLDHVSLNGTASGTDSGLGAQWNMSPNTGETADVTIENSSTSGGGNFYVSGMTAATISGNTFDGQGLALNGVTDASVTGNTFENVDGTYTANGTQDRGLTVENAWGTTGDSNITITGNAFNGDSATDGAIALQRWTDADGNPVPATIPTLNNVTIDNNTFTNDSATPIYLNASSFGPTSIVPSVFGDTQIIIGTSGNDAIVAPSSGNTAIYGGGGTDTVSFGAGYHLAIQGNNWVVTDGTITDTLSEIDKVAIAGTTYDLVDKFGTAGGFQSLQAAIDAAQNGDKILVAPGSYTESANYNPTSGLNDPNYNNPVGLLVDKGVTIEGVDASGAVITSAANTAATIVSSVESELGHEFLRHGR